MGPDFERPASPERVGLQPRAGTSGSTNEFISAPVPAAWWTLFDDATLGVLQTRAQAANLDLQMASARVAQSRAQLGIARALSWPRVAFEAGVAREALSQSDPLAVLGIPTTPHEVWQAGFDASWELDLWGHARRTREAAAASAEAVEYEREAVRVSLSAEITRSYLLLRGAQTELDIARQNRELAEHGLRLAGNREKHGVATRFETAAARAELARIDALLPLLAQQRDALLNALAVLLGEPPRSLDGELAPATRVVTTPLQVPMGLSSELARRRPDILQAEARLHAATASIGIAEADFYPRISLTGSLGTMALSAADLGNWSSRRFSIGPTLHLPIFEGGRLKRMLELAQAQQQAAAIAYQQTVLRAWHEVDDALHACAAQRQRHDALVTAVEQNRQALAVAQRSYQEGVADYLAVLSAQRGLLDSQMALAQCETAASVALVALYKALGGGWSPVAGAVQGVST